MIPTKNNLCPQTQGKDCCTGATSATHHRHMSPYMVSSHSRENRHHPLKRKRKQECSAFLGTQYSVSPLWHACHLENAIFRNSRCLQRVVESGLFANFYDSWGTDVTICVSHTSKNWHEASARKRGTQKTILTFHNSFYNT